MQGFDGEILDVSSGRARDATARRIRLLDVAATRFLVTTPRGLTETALGGLVARAGWKPVPTGGSLLAFENPRPVPRAFVVYRVRRAPPPIRLLARMARPSFDPLRVSYVEADVALAPGPARPRGEPATFVHDDEGTVELEATLRAPGLVALADSYYPGWRASVDGVPAPIVPTNHVFRGVVLPPGPHRVRFDYRPASIVTGAAATAVGLVGIGVLAVLGRRRRSYPESAPASLRTGTSRSRGGEIGRCGTDMMS